MAKTTKRRAYEYDHHYGLALGGKTQQSGPRPRLVGRNLVASRKGQEHQTICEEALAGITAFVPALRL